MKVQAYIKFTIFLQDQFKQVTDNIYNEKQLLLQLSEGNEGAFEKIYQLYSRRLYGKLLKFTKSELQAKELLQDIFLKIWYTRKNIDPEKSFRSYLFQIATNSAYDFFRKNLRDRLLQYQLLNISKYQYSHIEEALINKENNSILYRAINLLPPKRRNIYKLCKVDGKSYVEVSHQLGISPSTISDHIVKANLFIKNYLMRINA